MSERVSAWKQTKARIAAVPLAVFLTTLAGCGGGGDADAGAPTAFSVIPNTVTYTASTTASGGPPAGVCVPGYAGEFFVYGGTAPYRIDNTAPFALVINKATVEERGGSFTVIFTGGCVKPAIINIVDKLNHMVQLTLTNQPAS